MVIEERGSTFFVVGLVLFLIIFVAIIGSSWPTQEETFIELGLLGKDKTADSYFANEKGIVDVGALNSWYVYVHNHMGDMADVNVRAKLVNSILEMPDNRKHKPSDSASFAEFPLSLSVNETALLPFNWSIMKVEAQNGSIIVKSLLVNKQLIDVSVPVDSSLRIVLELWVRDRVSGEYKFGWESKAGFSSASIYMGFEINSNSEP